MSDLLLSEEAELGISYWRRYILTELTEGDDSEGD